MSHLPFPEAAFGIATAVETHYDWPDRAADPREILRVPKPGGTLAVVAEAYRGRRLDALDRPAMMPHRATYPSVREHGDRLSEAGLSNVGVFEDRRRGWICAAGKRPSPAVA